MSEHEIIRADIRPALSMGLTARVLSATGLGGDAALTLSWATGFAGEGESLSHPLEPDEAKRLWALLEAFEVHGGESDMIGLDGTTYALTIRTASHNVSLSWWEQPPSGWTDAARLVDELLRLAGPEGERFRGRSWETWELKTGDHVSSPDPLERLAYGAGRLMADHPPRLEHRNKRAVFDVACPPGCVHHGEIGYSRWTAMELPESIGPSAALELLQVRPDVYDYEATEDLPDAVEWHVNFADPHLFFGYSGGLFAQDEMQCAEHPVLGALREALLAKGRAALTVEDGQPTPVLVTGVERRCHIKTAADGAAGRPNGLYGRVFSAASEDAVRQATTRIQPPTITNLIAIAAPSGGYGRYNNDEIQGILVTAYSGFRAAVLESSRIADGAPTVVHTGFWGCGAFGGNRVLMTMLQVLAAGAAGVDHLVFHTVRAHGVAVVDEAQAHLRDALGSAPLNIEESVERVSAIGFEWGTRNGT